MTTDFVVMNDEGQAIAVFSDLCDAEEFMLTEDCSRKAHFQEVPSNPVPGKITRCRAINIVIYPGQEPTIDLDNTSIVDFDDCGRFMSARNSFYPLLGLVRLPVIDITEQEYKARALAIADQANQIRHWRINHLGLEIMETYESEAEGIVAWEKYSRQAEQAGLGKVTLEGFTDAMWEGLGDWIDAGLTVKGGEA